VQIGDTVLTSGGDQIFPKGLPVGRVTEVGKGRDLFLSIQVKPAADLSKLEEVLVVVEKHEQQSVAQDNVRIRAADILAQRLPSVPDKPADAGSSGGANSESLADPKPPQASKPGLNSTAPNPGSTKVAVDTGSPIKPPAQPKTTKTSSPPPDQPPAGDESRPN
jgi:rod shape-determining protein MreC